MANPPIQVYLLMAFTNQFTIHIFARVRMRLMRLINVSKPLLIRISYTGGILFIGYFCLISITYIYIYYSFEVDFTLFQQFCYIYVTNLHLCKYSISNGAKFFQFYIFRLHTFLPALWVALSISSAVTFSRKHICMHPCIDCTNQCSIIWLQLLHYFVLLFLHR